MVPKGTLTTLIPPSVWKAPEGQTPFPLSWNFTLRNMIWNKGSFWSQSIILVKVECCLCPILVSAEWNKGKAGFSPRTNMVALLSESDLWNLRPPMILSSGFLASFLMNMPHVYNKCYSMRATKMMLSREFSCRPWVHEEGKMDWKWRKDPTVSFEIQLDWHIIGKFLSKM